MRGSAGEWRGSAGEWWREGEGFTSYTIFHFFPRCISPYGKALVVVVGKGARYTSSVAWMPNFIYRGHSVYMVYIHSRIFRFLAAPLSLAAYLYHKIVVY